MKLTLAHSTHEHLFVFVIPRRYHSGHGHNRAEKRPNPDGTFTFV